MDTHAAMSLAPESLHASRRSASAMYRNSSRREAHMARYWASAPSISSWVVQSFRMTNTRHGHGGGLGRLYHTVVRLSRANFGAYRCSRLGGEVGRHGSYALVSVAPHLPVEVGLGPVRFWGMSWWELSPSTERPESQQHD